MFKKSQSKKIQVKAVKKDHNPRYPKAIEKVDFPFSKATTWPFSSLIVSSLLLASMSSETQSTTPSTTLQNPFQRNASVMVEFGGKGGPATLPKELAVEAIFKAFQQRGIPMQANVAYAKSGITVELDGYDSKTGIGFEFLESTCSLFTSGQDNPSCLDEKEEEKLYQDLAANKRKVIPIMALDKRFSPMSHNDEKTQLQALENLKKSIHEYIDFLKQQGAL